MKNLLLGLAFSSLTANFPVELKRDFSSANWQLPASGSGMVHYLGQESLYMSKGVALYGDEKYHEGIIEVDIADDDAKGEAGIVFRYTSDGAYRGITLNLHAINSPESAHPVAAALKQNSAACTPHAVKPAAWTHLKIVIQDNTARVFLNDATQPASEIKLPSTKKPVKGQIGLMAAGGAYFSNFKYAPLPCAPAMAKAE
ncbi:family 16 glycoside hydrolase [Rufibacter psychrotolerans]|uniref:family 16 glycoside hydrolase n=1 Tax=Rufibacter psychrotolerans TaxID=2812556 RepID=UPI00196753D7|nr:family 16 glycoside hydrolase [Rufibacter sp. SYSU D00308]